eukprot:SAG31_NODE_884_length_11256_cov_2.889666_5_plen_135_part_00
MPPRDPVAEPEVCSLILFLSDLADCGGATSVVTNSDALSVLGEAIMPRTYAVEGSRGTGTGSSSDTTQRGYNIRSDNSHPIYEREAAIEYRPGPPAQLLIVESSPKVTLLHLIAKCADVLHNVVYARHCSTLSI